MPSAVIASAFRRVGAATIGVIARLGFLARFFVAVLVHSPAAFRRLQLTLREIYFSGVLSLVIIAGIIAVLANKPTIIKNFFSGSNSLLGTALKGGN